MKFIAISALLVAGAFGARGETDLSSTQSKAEREVSVRPQDDLYAAVNGEWLRTTEIPSDKSNYSSFTALDDLSRDRIRALINEVGARKNAPGSEAQKIGDMYRSFMDEDRIEQLGLKPLQGELEMIRGLSTLEQVAGHFGHLLQIGVETPFHFQVDVDPKNSRQYLANLAQSGVGLPDRDYYLTDEPRSKQGREAYLIYLARLLTLAGKPEAEAQAAAQRILELETRFAKAHFTQVELRDPEKNYHKMSVSKLSDVSPKFPWNEFLSGLGASFTEINLNQPPYSEAVGEAFVSTPLETWKEYLEIRLLDTYAIGLSAPFQKAHFELHGAAIKGIPRDRSRSDKAVALVSGGGGGDSGVLGDAVGKLYVERYFPPEAKARMDELVSNLLLAFDQSIQDLTWMTPETKAKARAKLAKYTRKIGYPTRWHDYTTLSIQADDLVGNLVASQKHDYAYSVGKLGRAVDREEWLMTPQTVNAYYNHSMNEIVFPAAVLQPPFFDVRADDASNYGTIAAGIGHEISHGFDDEGSQYDGEGNLNNWWTDADRKAFEQLTKKLVSQYAAYEPLPGSHLNGELTLGENIADLSGLAVAHRAYRLSLKGKPGPVIGGLTADQRFFMSWAQVWRRKYRDADLARRLKTDPHAPAKFRANGAVVNLDAFAEAFHVQPGDRMYKAPEERIRIW